MKSPISKRSIVIAGHKTSVSLEDDFWNSLKEIARGRNITLPMVTVGGISLQPMPPARWLEPRMADMRAIRPVLIHRHDLLKR